MQVAAIYSRKSKFTGKGESVQNQIDLCKEYAKKQFNTSDFLIYEDEGYTGGNTDRPEFQRMVKDIKKNKINLLICYRLDRISRNISDFSNLIELLQKHDVAFVSIREQFDTSTPMGRAMMYITSIFAQLERETIADRVRDNMYQLARTGRWLGGRTPTGFKSESVLHHDHEGNAKKLYQLIPLDEELNLVKLLYEKYLEFKSLTQLESWTLENYIKSKNNKNFDKSSLKLILTNPVYAIADEELYYYFREAGSDIAVYKEEFDGLYGLMVFNKHNEKNNRVIRNDKADWIVALGSHKGVIPSHNWISVQNILDSNKSKAPRKGTGNTGLLSGLIKCKNCGSNMKVSIHRKREKFYFYYKCLLKERSKASRCNVKNLSGEKADQIVIQETSQISYKENEVYQYLNELKNDVKGLRSKNSSQICDLEKKIGHYNTSIHNLTLQLAENTHSVAAKHIINQIEEFDEKIKTVKNQIRDIGDEKDSVLLKQDNIDFLLDLIKNFSKNIHKLTFDEKGKLLKQIASTVTWDGEQIEVIILNEDIT